MDKATAPAPTFVGIDVARHSPDIRLRPSGEGLAVDHGEEEVAAWAACMRKLVVVTLNCC